MTIGHNSVAGDILKSIVLRIERLEEEKAGIAADIRDVYAEARGGGFDPKTIRKIIALRKKTEAEREEEEALLDIYKAALGMLDGTPLGEAAIKKLTKKPEPPKDESQKPDAPDEQEPEEEAEAPPAPLPGPTIEEAREMAKKAAEEGRPVTENPFPARDPRRAAYDEEWCKHSGSDGMELPEAFRRTPKKKEEPKEEE